MYKTVLRAEKELPPPHTTDSMRLPLEDVAAAGTNVMPFLALAAQAVVDTVTHL